MTKSNNDRTRQSRRQTAGSRPPNGGSRTKNAPRQPKATSRPQNTASRPQNTASRTQNNGSRPQNNGYRPQKNASRTQNTGYRSQNAVPRPKTAPPRRKRPLTPAQAEARRRKRLAEKKRALIKRARILRLIIARVTLFFVTFTVVLVLSITAFFLNLFNNGGKINKKDYVYQIDTGYNKEQISLTVPWNRAKMDGEFYVDFTRLAELYGFTITGDAEELRFIIKSGSDNVTFGLNGSYAEINGTRIRLPSNVYQIGESVYVPSSFVERYIKGLTVVCYEESHKVVVSRELITDDGRGGAPKTVSYKPVYFTARPMPTCDKVPESVAVEAHALEVQALEAQVLEANALAAGTAVQ